MSDLAAKADGIISIGTRAGEGWLLTAEMVELIELGAPNIICAQPFACLPNHVVGKGMFAELRRRHPESNITSIDYDPGASQTNQLNRIKLLVATAHKRHGQPEPEPARPSLLRQPLELVPTTAGAACCSTAEPDAPARPKQSGSTGAGWLTGARSRRR